MGARGVSALNTDAIDYEGGGGVCAHNLFELIRDDGIEIRLQPYNGPLLLATIRDNWIEGNQEDGIQFIDSSITPTRRIASFVSSATSLRTARLRASVA